MTRFIVFLVIVGAYVAGTMSAAAWVPERLEPEAPKIAARPVLVQGGAGPLRTSPPPAIILPDMSRFATTTTTSTTTLPRPRSAPTVRAAAPRPQPPRTAPNCGGWLELVDDYAWPVATACAILVCESKGDPNAVNRSSGASGLFQHLPPFPGVFDPKTNLDAAYSKYASRGWQPWAACL